MRTLYAQHTLFMSIVWRGKNFPSNSELSGRCQKKVFVSRLSKVANPGRGIKLMAQDSTGASVRLGGLERTEGFMVGSGWKPVSGFAPDRMIRKGPSVHGMRICALRSCLSFNANLWKCISDFTCKLVNRCTSVEKRQIRGDEITKFSSDVFEVGERWLLSRFPNAHVYIRQMLQMCTLSKSTNLYLKSAY